MDHLQSVLWSVDLERVYCTYTYVYMHITKRTCNKISVMVMLTDMSCDTSLTKVFIVIEKKKNPKVKSNFNFMKP